MDYNTSQAPVHGQIEFSGLHFSPAPRPGEENQSSLQGFGVYPHQESHLNVQVQFPRGEYHPPPARHPKIDIGFGAPSAEVHPPQAHAHGRPEAKINAKAVVDVFKKKEKTQEVSAVSMSPPKQHQKEQKHAFVVDGVYFALQSAECTEIISFLLLVILSLIFTIVASNNPFWFLILWCVFCWASAASSAVSLYIFYRIKTNYREKHQQGGLFQSLVTFVFSMKIASFAAMTAFGSILFMDYASEYNSEESTGLSTQFLLFWAGLISIPIICLKFVSAKTAWVVCKDQKGLFVRQSYLTSIVFSSLAWLVILLVKFCVVSDSQFLSDAVSDWFIFGTLALSIVAIVISAILVIASLLQIRFLSVFFGLLCLVLSVLLVISSGLQGREVKSLSESKNTLFAELPFRLASILIVGLTVYGLTVAGLSLLLFRDSGLKLKRRVTRIELLHLALFVLVNIGGLVLVLVIKPYGDTNSEVSQDLS